MLVDLRPFDAELTGKEAQNVLDRGRHHAQQEHRSPTTPARRSSPAACASARRRSRRRAWTEPEMADDRRRSSPGRCARRADDAELAAVRDDVADALLEVHARTRDCGSRSCRLVIAPDVRTVRAWRRSCRRPARSWSCWPSRRRHLRDVPLVRAIWPSGRRGGGARTSGGCTSSPRRRSAAAPCSSASSPACCVAWRMRRVRPVFAARRAARACVVAAVVIFAVGLIDDLREVSAPAKVAGMVLGGERSWRSSGVTIVDFRIPFVGFTSSSSPDLVRARDACCGSRHGQRRQPHRRPRRAGRRASSPSPPARSSSTASSLDRGRRRSTRGNVGPLVAIVIVLGMCLGFLPYNFHPAKIFMGDAARCCSGC